MRWSLIEILIESPTPWSVSSQTMIMNKIENLNPPS